MDLQKYYIPVILFIIFATNSFAQGMIDKLVYTPSPEASDLGRFGDIPMSYYTGRANVTVPIQRYTYRGVTLDVNLSYDTSGLQMNMLPGVLGPGWTLNAGGVITRVQCGHFDERTFDAYQNIKFSNYFDSHQELSNSQTYIVNNGFFKDYEPDFFYFNFLGKRGFFFLGHDGEWKVCSDNNLCVEFDINESSNYSYPIFSTYPKQGTQYKQPKAIKGFTIYDDEGNKYIFGYTTASVEYSMPFFKASDKNDYFPWSASSWYLTKVEDRFGNKLYEFTYSRGKFVGQIFKYSYSEAFNKNDFDYYSGWHSVASAYSGTLNTPVYLSQIKTMGGESISFTYYSPYSSGTAAMHLYPSLYQSDGRESNLSYNTDYINYPFYYLQANVDSLTWYRANNDNLYTRPLSALDFRLLNCIGVRNGLHTRCDYELEYDSIGRMHLTGLSAHNLRSTYLNDILYHYTFKYDNYQNVPPDYLTDIHDHWGFYTSPYQYGTEMQRRTPNFNYAVLGSLREIDYPTGGRSVLEYEPHNYSSVLASDRQYMLSEAGTTGGLRIKAIKEYGTTTGTSALKTRTFTYTTPTGTTSGQLFQKPQYYWHWQTGGNNFAVYQSVPTLPLLTASGTHIGYSYVTETAKDGSSHQYHFSNYSEVKDEPAIFKLSGSSTNTPFYRFGDMDFMRGKLLSEVFKDHAGQTYQLKTYEYRQDVASYMTHFSLAANIESVVNIHDAGTIYRIYYPKYDVEKIISSTLFGNQLINDTTYYTMMTYDTLLGNWQTKPYFRKCIQEKTVRGAFSMKKVYSYHPSSLDKYYIPVSSITIYDGNKLLNSDKVIYNTFYGHEQPAYETRQIASGPSDTLITYYNYTLTGLPQKYTRKGEYPTRLFWNAESRLLASVTSPYSESLTCTEIIKNNTHHFNNHPEISPLNVIKKSDRSIFEFPDVNAITNIYYKDGLLFMSATGNGRFQYYYYDSLGRLTEIRDQNDRILQQFKYNYSTSSVQ